MKILQMIITFAIIFNSAVIIPSSYLSPTKSSQRRQAENLLKRSKFEQSKSPIKNWKAKSSSEKLQLLCDDSETSSESDESNITPLEYKQINRRIALYRVNQKIQQLQLEASNSKPLIITGF